MPLVDKTKLEIKDRTCLSANNVFSLDTIAIVRGKWLSRGIIVGDIYPSFDGPPGDDDSARLVPPWQQTTHIPEVGKANSMPRNTDGFTSISTSDKDIKVNFHIPANPAEEKCPFRVKHRMLCR